MPIRFERSRVSSSVSQGGSRWSGYSALYSLEAEDADYWYFRSSAPLEFRRFEHGRPTEEHSNPGGLMLGKRSLRMVPAGAYIEGDGTSKIMVWKLGGDFLAMEGRQWRKSF